MGELHIPTDKKLKGPWLLGLEELEDLAKIFEELDEKLLHSYEKEIEYFANAEFQEGKYESYEEALIKTKKTFDYRTKVKKVTLVANDGKKLIDKSLKGILKDSNLKELYPKEISLIVNYGSNNEFTMDIKSGHEAHLSYNLKCYEKELQQDCTYEIEKWTDQNQPSKQTIFWSEYAILFRIISVFACFLLAFNIFTTEIPDTQSSYKKELVQLIEENKIKENEDKSFELLLKYVIDYKPKNIIETTKINPLVLKTFLAFLAIIIISIFVPTSIIGIGKSKVKLKYARVYVKLIYGIPAAIFLPFLIDLIKGYFVT